jgi:predicted transposase/invertase (TIGR01784 family)
MFTAKVREYESGLLGGKRPADITKDERKRIMKTAITKAVQWCIGNNVLRGFFEENGSEVINMLFDEWKLEDALVVEREEGREEGREERDAEIAKNALEKGASVEFVSEITGLTTETIHNLANR